MTLLPIKTQIFQILLHQTHPSCWMDSGYVKQKRTHKKRKGKKCTIDPIQKCAMITAKRLKAALNSKVTKFKLDEDPLQHRVYFLNFINSIKNCYHKFKHTCMFVMEYPYIEGEGMPDYRKQATWNLLHEYIYAHRQILIYEYPGDVAEAITRLKYQCANMTFAGKSIYNRQFHQVVHKGGESKTNHIKRF